MGTRPLNETVNLMMEIILEQIEIIVESLKLRNSKFKEFFTFKLDCVNETASLRNESKIDLEDFLFFFRKDKVRVQVSRLRLVY